MNFRIFNTFGEYSNLSPNSATCSFHHFSSLFYREESLRTAVMVANDYSPPLFSVAPMMDWTDHHYRTLARLLSKHTWLYTEMLAAETIVYQKGNLVYLCVCKKATELANAYCYDEINFNCGCPSPRVAGRGCFGARLMLDPKFVAEAISLIFANTNVPVTVKCRIGVDDHDSYNELCDFIYKVSSLSPAKHFIIHSRKALLKGLSPAENRSIPPLKYEYFYGLLRDFPDLTFTINGGITSIDEEKTFMFMCMDHDGTVVLMDPDSLDQMEVSKDLFSKDCLYLRDEMKVKVQFYDDKPLSASVPKHVTCIVKEVISATTRLQVNPTMSSVVYTFKDLQTFY